MVKEEILAILWFLFPIICVGKNVVCMISSCVVFTFGSS